LTRAIPSRREPIGCYLRDDVSEPYRFLGRFHAFVPPLVDADARHLRARRTEGGPTETARPSLRSTGNHRTGRERPHRWAPWRLCQRRLVAQALNGLHHRSRPLLDPANPGTSARACCSLGASPGPSRIGTL